MSNLMSQARTRVPRLAEAATIRARLSLVPARSSSAPRAPFVALVFSILALGVVGLLMFNTHMQQGAFTLTALQTKADALSAERQGLDMQLERLRDPQAVAVRGRELGMVAPADPAFVRLSDGAILGTPKPAVAGPDGVRVKGYPAVTPSDLVVAPKIVRVPAVTKAEPEGPEGSGTAKSKAGTGAASSDAEAERDKKKTAAR